MKFIGAHVSIAGGIENAPLRAAELGANAFALFTKNQKQWNAAPLKEEAIVAFRKNCAEGHFGTGQILPHSGYLINLAQPDPEKRARSLAAFIDEMERCAALGIDRLNFHPGSTLGELSPEEGMKLIAESVRAAMDAVPGVMPVLENTAGQGGSIGRTFEELAYLLEQVGRPGLGVCIDTCHAYVAGYDWVNDYARIWEDFDRLIGFSFLKGMHLNDAKGVLGSHLDRHECLGEGNLGWGLFEQLMRDSRLDGIPLTLETIDESRWPAEIRQLRAWTL